MLKVGEGEAGSPRPFQQEIRDMRYKITVRQVRHICAWIDEDDHDTTGPEEAKDAVLCGLDNPEGDLGDEIEHTVDATDNEITNVSEDEA
jgi:hypothetical protein